MSPCAKAFFKSIFYLFNNTVVKCAAPGSLADQPSKPQAPTGADAGAAGEPVLSHAATSAAGTVLLSFVMC